MFTQGGKTGVCGPKVQRSRVPGRDRMQQSFISSTNRSADDLSTTLLCGNESGKWCARGAVRWDPQRDANLLFQDAVIQIVPRQNSSFNGHCCRGSGRSKHWPQLSSLICFFYLRMLLVFFLKITYRFSLMDGVTSVNSPRAYLH